jgi:perosamine synthetase
MHTFGHPVDMHALMRVAGKYGLVVIEDAAESLGSLYENQDLGNFGRVAVLSFNGNKIVTTGGGGALLTNDAELAKRAKHLSTTAKLPHKWEFRHDEIAYNYRMPSLNAALGCAQLEQLPSFLERKRMLAKRYQHAFADVSGVDFFVEPSFARSNYWLNAIMVRRELAHDFSARDAILQALNDAGFMARPAWTLINRLPMFENCPTMDLPVAQEIERRLVNIPSSAGLVEPE